MVSQSGKLNTVVHKCRKCGKLNRTPKKLAKGGSYTCGSCGTTLVKVRGDIPRWLIVLLGLWLGFLAALTIGNIIGPDRVWFGSFNLYIPQAIYSLPAVLLIPLAFRYARHLTWLPVLGALWVFGPIMGFVWTFPPDVPNAPKLRVLTYNVKWGKFGENLIADEIVRYHPDLVLFQDSNGVTNGTDGPVGKAFAGYNVRIDGQYIIASKYPLSDAQSLDISYNDQRHHIDRVAMKFAGQWIAVYDAHLLTPRSGLIAVRHHDVGGMAGNANGRLYEGARLAAYVSHDHGPLILTGDLNSPMASVVCQSLTGLGLQDAFSEAGRGYGFSYGQNTKVRMPYVRIDHIFASRHWTVTHCETGSTRGSEHVDVIADLALTNPHPL